jgi:hypothetical protein
MTDNQNRIREITLENIDSEIRKDEDEARKAVFLRQFNEVKARQDADREAIVRSADTVRKLNDILNPCNYDRRNW